MTVRHFLSLSGLGPETLSYLVEQSLAIATGPEGKARPLEDKIAGIYFRCSSTRTCTAFTVGALRLGGKVIRYGPNDLQIVTGESVSDTGRVLSGYLDLLVVRTNGSIDEMEALAGQGRMAVINAMSENEHPTQAIADLATIREALGRLYDVHILYIGEGNNSAVALAFAVAQTPGMRLTVVTPEEYDLPRDALERARNLAKRHGAEVEQLHDLTRLPRGVDVVYTTRWCTMGAPKTDPNWREKFELYRVNAELMAEVSKPSGTIFLHDLPAMRGQEVTDEVLDGPQSLAFRQARHKLNSAMAILSWCVGAA
ncbi:MAG TPA: ornithine carbamoyltransferase [Blastocatellia bacterium]|jgi:ornithine carbamoyltransferase|nr:ornithine carbamoyltransferase [Blastocatellia bacterium]